MRAAAAFVALTVAFAAASLPASAVPRPGEAAPALVLPAVGGGSFSLARARGKPVYLNFFATWCGPCRVETPSIVRLQQRYAARGLQVVGIDVGEDLGRAQGFGAEFKIPYRLLADPDGKTRDGYGGGLFFPLHVFIDRRGIVRTYRPGEMDERQIDAAMRAILR